jgi:hypothetical protein
MSDLTSSRLAGQVLLAVLAAGLAGACGQGEPRTDAERLTRGRQIIENMSAKIASAQSITFSAHEVRDQVKSEGEVQRVTLERQAVLRRPDRLYIKTAGDQNNEVWYDGVGLSVVLHKDKVFGQAPMPKTIDKTLDAMHERYGVATPLADFAYSSPAKALLSDTTKGGWVGRETIDGQPTDHVSFSDTGITWEAWIAATGDPLPKKGIANFTDNKHLRRVELTFSDWNLAAQIPDDRFNPTVPADYEGIAMLQRARILKNVPKDDAGAPSSPAGKE